MLLAAEALFLGGGNDYAIAQQTGGAVMVKGRNTEKYSWPAAGPLLALVRALKSVACMASVRLSKLTLTLPCGLVDYEKAVERCGWRGYGLISIV